MGRRSLKLFSHAFRCVGVRRIMDRLAMGVDGAPMFKIDPQLDLYLAREFLAAPAGPHSPNLQRLLRVMRGGELRGKFAALATKSGREWTLIQLSGDPDIPPLVHHDCLYTDPLEAEKEVFRRRWMRLTGEALSL